MHTAIKISTVVLLIFAASISAQSPGSTAYLNDNTALNYVLTLELLEQAFYNGGFNAFNQTTFANAGVNSTWYNFLRTIQDHENDHVATLNANLVARNATPVTACTYNFTYTNVSDFLRTAASIENTIVSAYIGSVDAFTDEAILTYAMSVATVEARQSAFLNVLIGDLPFPTALDTPLSPQVAFANISQYIVTCPMNTTFPVTAESIRNASAVNGTSFNTSLGSPAYLNDNKAVNYALSVENLGFSFFNFSLSNFTQTDFTNAGFNSSVYNYLLMIRDQEAAHIASLRTILSNRGATADEPCTYNFTSIANVSSFLETARNQQNVAVSAFNGAARTITDPAILLFFGSVATVEGRHSAFLNEILGFSPFPTSTDTPLEPDTVAGLASPFIVSCPQNFSSPVPASTFRNTTAVTSTGGTTSLPSTSGVATGSSVTTGVFPATSGLTTGAAAESSEASIITYSIVVVVAFVSMLI